MRVLAARRAPRAFDVERAADDGPDDVPVPPLLGLAQPVVPVGVGPLRSQFLPDSSREHPAEPPEKVAPLDARYILRDVNMPPLPVVVPGRRRQNTRVGVHDRRDGREEAEEVRRYFQILLEDDDSGRAGVGEGLGQRLPEVAREAVVAVAALAVVRLRHDPRSFQRGAPAPERRGRGVDLGARLAPARPAARVLRYY